MIGIYLNLILFTFAILSLTAGIYFYMQKSLLVSMRIFTLLISFTTFLICSGYSVMGLTPNVDYAYIPRFFGLLGIDSFLLLELTYLLLDMKIKKVFHYLFLLFFSVFGFMDLILHGSKDSFLYIRHDTYTTYEINNIFHHTFHCTYVVCIALMLVILAVKCYRKIPMKRDKQFILSSISANIFVLITSMPSLTGNSFFVYCPSLIYCTGFTFIFFIFFLQLKKRATLIPSVENVSKEIFQIIDVPVLIFNMDGRLDLFNTSAGKKLQINGLHETKIRDLFSLTDVEELHLMAKAKKSINGGQNTTVRTTGRPCTLNYFVKLDYTGEPFCILMTVLTQEAENERL